MVLMINMLLKRGSMPPMTLNVRTWGGHAFLSQWSLMKTVFNRLASLLAFGHSSTKPRLLIEIYSLLNMSLARSAAKAIMGRVLV